MPGSFWKGRALPLLLASALGGIVGAAGCGGKPETGTSTPNIEPPEERQSMEDAMKKYSEQVQSEQKSKKTRSKSDK